MSPWHAGEVSLQRLVGSAGHLGLHGQRIFRDTLSDQHRNFYPRLPFAVLGGWSPESLRTGNWPQGELPRPRTAASG